MVGIGIRLGLGMVSGGLVEKILGTENDDLLGYWLMDESSGVTADNAEGTAARDGTYIGSTLGQSVAPFTAVLMDGVNDCVDIFSLNLQSAFSATAGTMLVFAKVSGSGVWTDGSTRQIFYIAADSNNRIFIQKDNANNQLQYFYIAGGTIESVTKTAMTTTDWMCVALTWDKTADEVKAYYNGVQEGTTLTGLGNWVGSLGSQLVNFGTADNTPAVAQGFDGYQAHGALWSKALTAAQILAICQASGIP